MAAKKGYLGKIYRNVGTWAAPSWNEIPLVGDVSIPMSRNAADMSNRGGGEFKTYLMGQIDAGLNVKVIWDQADADVQALLDAFIANTSIELAIMDGAIATAGSEGLHADFVVQEFPRAEALDEGMTVEAVLKPAQSANDPEWMVVAS